MFHALEIAMKEIRRPQVAATWMLLVVSASSCFDTSQRNQFERTEDAVLDHSSGLTWQASEAPQLSWDDAVTYCLGRHVGGYDDWRLASYQELSSILGSLERLEPAGETVSPSGTDSRSHFWTRNASLVNPQLSEYCYGVECGCLNATTFGGGPCRPRTDNMVAWCVRGAASRS